MAEDPHQEDDPKPKPGWDYSSHPLKVGGMQIIMVYVACVALMCLTALLLIAWFRFS